jgi:hypothetical protein
MLSYSIPKAEILFVMHPLYSCYLMILSKGLAKHLIITALLNFGLGLLTITVFIMLTFNNLIIGYQP